MAVRSAKWISSRPAPLERLPRSSSPDAPHNGFHLAGTAMAGRSSWNQGTLSAVRPAHIRPPVRVHWGIHLSTRRQFMATNQAFAPATAPNLSFSLLRVLSLPWLDRTIAAVACVPLVYLAYYRYQHWHHGLPLITSALGVLILVVTMIIRRPPKRRSEERRVGK